LPGEYRRLLGFLEVDPGFVPDFTPANENKRVRNRWLQRLIWDPPLVRPLIPVIRRFPAAHALRGRLLALNSRREARSPMDPALRARLQAEFRPEVERLGRLIGRDLSGWSAPGDASAA
jgi:hypothetical protein